MKTWQILPMLLGLAACSSEYKLRAGCEGGDPGACDVLSARYAFGDGVTKDDALAATYARRALQLCQKPGADPVPSCVRHRSAVPIDLPKLSSSDVVQSVLTITLAVDGKMFGNGAPLADDDALMALAKDAHSKAPDLAAVIEADKDTTHGRVIHVLDVLKQAGISKIALGTGAMAPPPPPSRETP